MDSRLPARLEVDALIRRAQVLDAFATVLHKGDPDRGQIILLIVERGAEHSILERALSVSGEYHWEMNKRVVDEGTESLWQWVAKRRNFDPDLWLIELDVPDAERFIAETTLIG